MSLADRERWDARWRARSQDLAAPEPFLVENACLLRPGPALDVAAGGGRNALFLAARGHPVTAVDVSPEALRLLEERAREAGAAITVRCADLDDPRALRGLGPFADVVVIRYRPSRAQWARILRVLAPGGRLLVCTFAAEDPGIRREHRLLPGEPGVLFPGLLRLLSRERFEQAGRILEGSVWERKESGG